MMRDGGRECGPHTCRKSGDEVGETPRPPEGAGARPGRLAGAPAWRGCPPAVQPSVGFSGPLLSHQWDEGMERGLRHTEQSWKPGPGPRDLNQARSRRTGSTAALLRPHHPVCSRPHSSGRLFRSPHRSLGAWRASGLGGARLRDGERTGDRGG